MPAAGQSSVEKVVQLCFIVMRVGVIGTCDAQIWEDTQELKLVVD